MHISIEQATNSPGVKFNTDVPAEITITMLEMFKARILERMMTPQIKSEVIKNLSKGIDCDKANNKDSA
jgi:hypothetical protein